MSLDEELLEVSLPDDVLPDVPDVEPLGVDGAALGVLELPVDGDIDPLDEDDDGEPVDGVVEDEEDDGGVTVEEELLDAGGVDEGVVSFFWQPASPPSIRTTPRAAQAVVFMEPPNGIEQGREPAVRI